MVSRREVILICKILSNDLRLEILQSIDREGQQSMAEIIKYIGGKHSDTTISGAVKSLKLAGLLDVKRDGITPIYRLNRDNPMTILATEILEAIDTDIVPSKKKKESHAISV